MPKSRITNVQVPGETPAANESETEAMTGDPSSEGAKPEVTDADVGGVAGSVVGAVADLRNFATFDLEAIKAQAMAEARAELAAEIAAARRASENQPLPTAGSSGRTGRDYRNLHASQVDPKAITAPVLTKDGWVCPDVPVTAKARE